MNEQKEINRCSVISYSESIDSTGLNTPMDASPTLPSSPIISIVNDDPLPNIKSYPDITYANRRRAQTSPKPVPFSILKHSIPQQQPTMVSNNSKKHKLGSIWPKIKRSFSSTGDVSCNKSKFWFHKNRIAPQ